MAHHRLRPRDFCVQQLEPPDILVDDLSESSQLAPLLVNSDVQFFSLFSFCFEVVEAIEHNFGCGGVTLLHQIGNFDHTLIFLKQLCLEVLLLVHCLGDLVTVLRHGQDRWPGFQNPVRVAAETEYGYVLAHDRLSHLQVEALPDVDEELKLPVHVVFEVDVVKNFHLGLAALNRAIRTQVLRKVVHHDF